MKRLAILLFLIAAVAQGAEPDRRAILIEFSDFLAIPNLASDAPNIARNAAAIRAMFDKRGVTTRLLTLDNAPPIVVVDVPARGATRTIAFYAHYDGQPVDPKQWQTPPWTPVMRDAAGNDVDWRNAKTLDPEWRLYARSSGDDKAPIIAMAAALDALRAAGRTPNVNLRLVFEGEEEAGSPHLGEYLAKYPDVLRPDAWILCDGPVHQSRRMQLVFGARGVVDAELTVYGPVKGLHDGHYGNWVPNPIIRLTHLIDSMRDETGRILIKHFYDDVKPSSAAEQEAIAKMPPVESDLKHEFGLAATESDNLNESLMRPALNVRGIQSGHIGAQASNTIQTEATASLDFRLVPAETPESIKKLVEQHIQSQGYTIVRTTPDAATRLDHPKIAKLTWGAGYPPARTPLDLPLSKQIAALMATAGHPPIRVPPSAAASPCTSSSSLPTPRC
jgi:acetylornithine deacetylase/succinyl-diaminopimelate desuccinylase-like protein